jgi:26S proteasome regulatory subunit N2
MDTDDKEAKEGGAKKEGGDKEEEGPFYTLDAPCRITPAQVAVVRFPPASRWVPVRPGAPPTGILVLRDTQPGTPVEYASSAAVPGSSGGVGPGAAGAAAAGGGGAAAGGAAARQEAEPAPPEPFGEQGMDERAAAWLP